VSLYEFEPIGLDTLDAILPAVEQPARYTGGEWNSIRKQWDAVSVRFALAFPELYEVGMSNLGLAILYDLLNAQPDVLAERVYAPAPDMEKAMRTAGLPLYSLESRRPLRAFDIIGFSLAYELNYTNVLNMLDLAGLAVWARDRASGDPLVVAGGSMALNPEPMAEFFDLFVIGDGEEAVLELTALYRRMRQSPSFSKQEFLRQAASLAGVYVPSLYSVRYCADGAIAAVAPLEQGAPRSIRRRVVRALPPPPVRPVVPYVGVIHDRANLEIQRGCAHACRFCHAGIVYRPLRRRPRQEIVDAAEAIIRNTGHEEVALVSLSSADYEGIESLLAELLARHQEQAVSFSLPSLRIDSFSVRLASLTQERRKTGLTFAPEAGSQRLRDVINKGVTEADLLRTVEAAFGAGWRRVKLYFMLGLPTETEQDIEAIVDLTYKVREVGRRVTGRRVEVSVSVATFVPKPFTPFQWTGLLGRDEIVRRQGILKTRLRGKGLTVGWHDPDASLLEATLARGDRRVAQAIYRAWRKGAVFDAWGDRFKPDIWWAAFEESALAPDFYARRPRAVDEALPWDHIDVGVSKQYLIREWERSQAGETTPGCSEQCAGCGIRAAYGDTFDDDGAVCWERVG